MVSGTIPRQKFKQIARNLLDLLEAENMKTWVDLEYKTGETIPIPNLPQERVEISLRPSNMETLAYTISYIWEGVGIPIEAIINVDLGYNQIIIKLQETIPSYEQFAEDPHRNIVQAKFTTPNSLEVVKQELRDLAA